MCRARTAFLAIVFSAYVLAQTPTATLVGNISDTSRAAVAGASVKVREVSTNEIRTTQSQANGEYTVSNLAPGVYEVTVDKSGFRRLVESNLELRVGATARLDAQLQVGAVSETIEVKAEVPLVNTESVTRGDVITTREISQMPLNGRDFNDLVFMVAGVAPAEQNAKGAPYSINGTRADQSNVIIDGINDENPRDAGAQARPPLDSLQEFKVDTSGYSAQYGRLAGGVISMALKSGGNDVHGSVFELIRNDVFDARSFFDPGRNKLIRNQFGATVTGPVTIPKLYHGRNKTFFLGSWESYRQINGSSNLNVVPTLLERQGNFSQSFSGGKLIPVKDPTATGTCSATVTTACFPGNIIPASRISPIAAKVMNYYPLPNTVGANNYIAGGNTLDNWDNFLFKVDQNLGDKNHFAFRVLQRWETSTNPFSGSNLGTFPASTDLSQTLLGATYTRIITPNLINEFRAGLTRTTSLEIGAQSGTYFAGQFGIPGTASDLSVAGFPKFTITNEATLGTNSSDPIEYVVNNYDYSDTMNWSKGRHTISMGFEFLRTQFFQPTNTNFNGTFAFNGKVTGDALADFELGDLSSSSRKIGSAWNYIFQSTYGFYLQDDFKIRPNLTLNLGIRYEIQKPPMEKYGQFSSYDLAAGKLIIAGASAVPNLAATLAAAGLTGEVALASAYGLPSSLVYTNYNNFAPRVGFAWRPFGDNRTVVRSGYGIFYTGNRLNPARTDLTGGFPFAANQTFNMVASNPSLLTLANPFPDSLATFTGTNTTAGYDIHASTQYLQSWNFTVERELGAGFGIEAGYIGSKGTHLGRKYDINSQVRAPGTVLSNGSYPRPYPGFGDIEFYAFGQNSSYNAATFTLRKQFSHGLFFRANYTYAKSIDTNSGLNYAGAGGYAGAQNSQDLSAERGLSDFDVRHAFSMNFVYQLQLGKNVFLKGWQLAGSGRMNSGMPFTPVVKSATADLGQATRPDRLGNGSLSNPTPSDWFNAAAFVVVPDSAFRFGNSGRNILTGPGFGAFNLAFSRTFSIRERVKAQFRWEAFNFTNHPNFNLPVTSIDTATAGTITSAQAGRVQQLGLRIEF